MIHNPEVPRSLDEIDAEKIKFEYSSNNSQCKCPKNEIITSISMTNKMDTDSSNNNNNYNYNYKNNIKREASRTESLKKTLSRLNPKRCCKTLTDIKRNLDRKGSFESSSSEMASGEGGSGDNFTGSDQSFKRPKSKGRSNNNKRSSVNTLELFRYASFRERVAVILGLFLMLYAASWQPISVFILAFMASLMGQYLQRTNWLRQAACQANFTEAVGPLHQTQLTTVSGDSRYLTDGSNTTEKSVGELGVSTLNQLLSNLTTTSTFIVSSIMPTNNSPEMDSSSGQSRLKAGVGANANTMINSTTTISPFVTELTEAMGSNEQAQTLPMLRPIYTLLEPIFFSSNANADRKDIDSAIYDLFQLETRRFLRSSLEVNGSAFVLALTQLLSFFIGITLIAWVAKQQASRIKILFFRSCLSQELTWFEAFDNAAGSGSSLNTLVSKYEDGIGIKLALLSYFIGHIVLFALTAFYQLAGLAACCLPFVLIVWLVIAYLSDLQSVAIGDHSMFVKRSLHLAEEIIRTIRTIFSFNGQKKELSRFNGSLEPVYKKSLVKHLYTALNTSISKFSIFACFAIYCFIARRLFPPYDPLGPKSRASVLAVMRGAEVSIVNILISIPFMEALQQSKGCIARIYQIIERKSKINPFHEPDEDDSTPAKEWDGSISFRQVQFSYARRSQISVFGRRRSSSDPCKKEKKSFSKLAPMIAPSKDTEPDFYEDGCVGIQRIARSLSDADRHTLLGTQELILTGLTLDIKAGQSVALVGPSGSGKSTVLSLVQRLYDITSGHLLLGDNDIRSVSLPWLRNQIGVVTQEPRLFDLTISENIQLGLSRIQSRKWDEHTIEQQVREAARLAGAHTFISRLPMGYSTRVGSGGVQLSGGQKQRIAIARALIRRPKLLLLDECTSALDSESEAQVMAALKFASVGRTTLTVAHRLCTIQGADMIIVMDHGRVIESGTHVELMEAHGMYRRLYDEQSSQNSSHEFSESSESTTSDTDSFTSNSLDLADSELPILDNIAKSRKKSIADSRIFTRGPKASVFSHCPLYLGDISMTSIQAKATGRQLLKLIELPKWATLAAIISCLLAGLILPMNLIAHSYLFAAFANQSPEQLGNSIYLFGLIILSFSALVFIISFLQIILPGYVGEKLSMRLRSKIIESLLKKPIFYFDLQTNGAGALCDRFNSHISNIQSIAGARIATLIEACSTLLVSAAFGFILSPSLSMFCLGFALFVLFTTMIESRLMQLESNRERLFDMKTANLMEDALSNIKTIASLNGEPFFLKRLRDIIVERQRGSTRSLLFLRTFLTSLKFVMPALSNSASMYFGSILLVDGQIDLQTVFIVCPVVLFAVNDTFRALVFLPELVKAKKSLQHLYQMHEEFSPQALQTQTLGEQLCNQSALVAAANSIELSSPSSSPSSASEYELPTSAKSVIRQKTSIISINRFRSRAPPTKKQIMPVSSDRRLSNLAILPTYIGNEKVSLQNSLVPKGPARGQIEFRSVRFAYPTRPNQLTLDGLSLTIEPGQCVALVGASGSGKSSVVALLEKFYDFHAGQIILDGQDIRLIESNWVRSQIGLVSQEPTLFSCSIGDNIRYGDNSHYIRMDQIIEAAKAANIHDFIMSLPNQYETQLSHATGSQLSGGQRQRIAIARALVRRAPILIFDEATSALDTQNESLVQEALKRSRRGRTSLVIAHRLASIKDADKIVVMREGRVVEIGTHHELMKLPCGQYRALWMRQESHSLT